MPIRPEADELVAFLNDVAATDPDFMQKIVDFRPPCNAALAEHPTVQVGVADRQFVAGIIGILNGFIGTIDEGPRKGWGVIAAVYEGGKLIRFAREPEG